MFRIGMNYLLAGACALSATALSANDAQAYGQNRNDSPGSVSVRDYEVPANSRLSGTLSLSTSLSKLDITTATNVGRYNARLSTRCGDGFLDPWKPRELSGNQVLSFRCQNHGGICVRNEGALDDI